MTQPTNRVAASPATVQTTPSAATPADAAFPLYNPAFEHDACGTGFIASVEGQRSHRLVELALKGLSSMAHRGAVSADGVSGDGAGLTLQIPVRLLESDAIALGASPSQVDRLALGMVFLPRDGAAAERARTLLEDAVRARECTPIGWRPVPTRDDVLGATARSSRPAIEQFLFSTPADSGSIEVERALYVARRAVEAAFRGEGLRDAYIVSLSSRTVVYKGLLTGTDLATFYPDLGDERTETALAVFHERFATNTFPEWKLAQPFRRIAHNGEVNTLLGNRRWMEAREPDLASSALGSYGVPFTPVLSPDTSDTGALDEALDLLVASGRGVLEAMAILIPEAWERMPGIDPELRAFYEYHACLTEPWDGPAGVVFTDGETVAACVDRNGLRPSRYQVTRDGIVIASSEVGILGLPADQIVESGRVGPGQMIAVDTVSGSFLHDHDIKRALAERRPWAKWVGEHLRRLDSTGLDASGVDTSGAGTTELATTDVDTSDLDLDLGGPPVGVPLDQFRVLHSWSAEELKLVLGPMADSGKEGIGSMGDDTPLSVLSTSERPLYSYMRQRFAQVTNPPIDSIRERLVTSLDSWVGARASLFESPPEAPALLHLPSPLVRGAAFRAVCDPAISGLTPAHLSTTFPCGDSEPALADALELLTREAEAAVRGGADLVVLSDRAVDEGHAPIPMLLAVSAVHQHLVRSGLRMRTGIAADTGDARDVHHFAALLGFGATIVHPWLALATVAAADDDDANPDQEEGEGRKSRTAVDRYLRAADAGLLKIMSKMGISSIASYRGAQIFEAIGLGDELVSRYFDGTTSRIGGIDLLDIEAQARRSHARAFDGAPLEKGGWYRYRRNSEYHANEPPVWRALQSAVQSTDAEEYRQYSDLVHGRTPTALRDLLDFQSDREPIDIDRVEPVASIVARLQTGAMSLGALSAEAHEDVARAMNLLGALSNSGEGGEDPERYSPHGTRRDAVSQIKQVASGRFGVTTGYLASATEIEIKMAQGSKPGEGGQLPGEKVSAYIATLRHVRPGTPLISPPPHHDIYSIEDLAQLIFDLKTVNPSARVAVKLVSSEGVGTIAAGVAKADADVIHISGADGGTGASPLSSIKNAGAPWELGIAEAQQTLVRNGLRGRVKLTTDGGFHTGRDVVKAALLGAERYGFGTATLIAIGCKMARQCHSNTCPVGIATQAEDLRKKYFGTPEMLVSFFLSVAREVREILAWLGYERLEDLIGRSDLLAQREAPADAAWRGVDLSRLVGTAWLAEVPAATATPTFPTPRADAVATVDDAIIARLWPDLEQNLPYHAEHAISNADRTVGSRLSGRIARTHGDEGLPPSSIHLTFRGSAGQSFGAWLVPGLRLDLIGEANDYVGKGMTGGVIALRPAEGLQADDDSSIIAGNTLLYGATGGELYVAGRVGERFAVRNSGAAAVVEGVGKHGCEYMTGGTVVVLGPTGRNFGAGMSGGRAYVLDERGDLGDRLNRTLVDRIELTPADERRVRALLEAHLEHTGSKKAGQLLADWPAALATFCKVAPRRAADFDEEIASVEDGPPTVMEIPSTVEGVRLGTVDPAAVLLTSDPNLLVPPDSPGVEL